MCPLYDGDQIRQAAGLMAAASFDLNRQGMGVDLRAAQSVIDECYDDDSEWVPVCTLYIELAEPVVNWVSSKV